MSNKTVYWLYYIKYMYLYEYQNVATHENWWKNILLFVIQSALLNIDKFTHQPHPTHSTYQLNWTATWWWAEAKNSESPERPASVFAFLSVCLSVCYQATGHNFLVFSSLSLYWPQVTPFDLQTIFFACRLDMT